MSLFYINIDDGSLKHMGTFSCEGNSPRDFQLDPEGNHLFCANENSDNISIFSIDQKTGNLTFLKSENIPTPTCIEFI